MAAKIMATEAFVIPTFTCAARGVPTGEIHNGQIHKS